MSPWEMVQESGRVCSDKPWPGVAPAETWLCDSRGRLALHLGTHNTLPPLDLTGGDYCHSEEAGASLTPLPPDWGQASGPLQLASLRGPHKLGLWT